ncbi:hypothetical protein [Moorena sp. SIO1F2]|nr:hypothetical protein [Moorena sp. SIO1F2]
MAKACSCSVAQALALAFGHATRMATLCERRWELTHKLITDS